jgi:hypothetical protein
MKFITTRPFADPDAAATPTPCKRLGYCICGSWMSWVKRVTSGSRATERWKETRPGAAAALRADPRRWELLSAAHARGTEAP